MTARYARPAALPPPGLRLLVVEASAGTGKTYFLEHRVVDLLLQTRATIGEILVVTFTEKATAELRARIRALIGALEGLPDGHGADLDPATSWTIDAAARRKLRDALTGFDRAPIHTIHGFCHRLLIDDAFAGHRLFDQRQIPDEAAFAEAFHLALRERFAVDPGDTALLDAYLGVGGNTVAKMRDALLMCARRAAPITPVLDEARLTTAASRLVKAVAPLPPAAIEAALGKIHKKTRETFAKRVLELCELLAAAPDALALSALLSGKDAAEKLKYLMEKVELVTEPAGAALCAAVAELSAAHTPILAICARRFLPEVMARVRTTKARRGHFDFQDMLRLVGEALAGERGPELAARLRAMHPWALIDEFQDTDDVQWDIFRTVWAEGASTSLAIVGDPKQAIYSFRGADVHTYLRARAELLARGAATVALADNHRSSADLVAAVNALVGGRDYAPFFTGDITYDAPVRAASGTSAAYPDGRAPSPVHVFEIDAPSGGQGKNDAVAATLAERIGDEVHALLAPPPEARLQLVLRDGARALRPADIHVLTRSGRQSDEVAAALRARGVPCALFQREHLFDAAEAREVADLLDAIADPRDRSRRLRAWTTSFFAVPLAELGAVTEVPDEHPLIALLHEWRGLALRKDYDALLHRVLDDTRWVERALVAGGGERAVTNVLHLFELLHDEVARSRCEIHELAARLRGWIRMGTLDRPDDLDLQRLETDRQAVQVMTIHRAKGLEAAIVFVHGGHTAVPLGRDQASLYHDRGERRIHVGAATGATAEAIEQDVVEENQRLLYVAMTRARVRLYLPVVRGTNLASTAALAAVQPCLIGALAARATDPESARLFTSERIAAGSLEAPAPAEAAEDLRGWTPPPAPPPPADDPLWEDVRTRRAGAVVTSYSKLKQQAAPEEAAAPVLLDDRELPGGASTGLFLHEVLEHVTFASALETGDAIAWSARADVAPVFDAAARRHGLDRRHRDVAAQLLHRTLTREIPIEREVLPPLARAPRVAKEVEFLYPLQDRAFARGFIDLLVGWDDRLWVVDYKSDVLATTTQAAARVHTREHYWQQLQLYAVAAARLLGLDGEDACRARFGGVLYWYLRYDYVIDEPVRWADVGQWTGALAKAVTA